MTKSVRSRLERVHDTKRALQAENQAWFATASPVGLPYMIPLTYAWDGTRFIFATLEDSRTAQNLRHSGVVRLSLPSTVDVVLIDGTVDFDVDQEALGRTYASTAGWDPLGSGERYAVFIVLPIRIMAWRNESELTGRVVMTGGVWFDQKSEHSGSEPV